MKEAIEMKKKKKKKKKKKNKVIKDVKGYKECEMRNDDKICIDVEVIL